MAQEYTIGRADNTAEGTTAVEALEKGFNDLMDLCDVVSEKFQEERLSFIDKMKA
jgi:DNA-directed RNA polymerase I and III subunit RPAC2